MPASTRTAERSEQPQPRWLIGLIAEHRELAMRLAEHPDLLVIETDPLSGTSALLATALADVDRDVIEVDARAAADAADLAMAIAAAGIARLAPQAMSWWNGGGAFDAEGLRLSHALSRRGVDLDRLRVGAGSGADLLRDAFQLVVALCDGEGLLAVDHLDDLLVGLSVSAASALLGSFRAEHQRSGSIAQLLVGRTEGRLASALRSRAHPLYRAGDVLQIRRPRPRRFVDDLAIDRPWANAPVDVIGAAAEIAAGAPAYVWRIVDAASVQAGEPRTRALAAWHALRGAAEPSAAQQFRLLGSVHRAAPSVVGALACGNGPYELPLNPKSVRDALSRMRARGQVFSPGPQRWAVSDPLLASWARDHASPRIGRMMLR